MDKVCRTAAFILGPDVAELESRLCSYTGSKYCVSVGSGTVAIEVLLRALNIGPGDEVITIPFTWISTAECISLVGATPCFVDVEPHSFNMDPKKLKAAIKPGVTKAILCVSFHGQCSKIDELIAIAAEYNIPVLEDGAQSFGAQRNNVPSCGPIPGLLASTTSFYPAKPYGCYGDGGAIFTSDETLANKLRAIRTYGGTTRDNYPIIGTNARLDTIQAAVLLVKLNHYNSVLERRRQVAAWYDEALKGSGVAIPETLPGNTHTYAQYTIGVRNRNAICDVLKTTGIPHGIYYATPLHLQGCFSNLGLGKGSFPVSEELCNTVLSLPIHQYVTKEQVKAVADAVRQAVKDHNGSMEWASLAK